MTICFIPQTSQLPTAQTCKQGHRPSSIILTCKLCHSLAHQQSNPAQADELPAIPSSFRLTIASCHPTSSVLPSLRHSPLPPRRPSRLLASDIDPGLNCLPMTGIYLASLTQTMPPSQTYLNLNQHLDLIRSVPTA
jgi:hypothetical protein